jgi:hypothetical protein
MNMEVVESFLRWCIILNLGCSLFAMIAVTGFKKKIYKIHSKIFSVSEEIVAETVYKSLTTYKTIFVFFNVIPYIVIKIIK